MGLEIKFDLPTDRELERMLNLVPKFDRYKVLDQAVSVAGTPILRRAQQLAPDGNAKRQWSKRRAQPQREGRPGPMTIPWAGKRWKPEKGTDAGDTPFRWKTPLKKTVSKRVKKYTSSAVVLVGPRRPEGNKVFFNAGPNGRQQWLWGRKQSKTIRAIEHFVKKAFDETKREQLGKMKARLRELIDQAMSS